MFIRQNLVHGLLSPSGISDTDTIMESPGLQEAPDIEAPHRMRLVLNPLRQFDLGPEFVDITSHVAGSSVAVIERSVEDSDRFPALSYPVGTGWAATDTIATMDQSETIGSARKVAFQWSPNSASSEWSITHGLGFRPSGIIVIDSGGRTMYGFDVEHISSDELVLRFNAGFIGTAYLS